MATLTKIAPVTAPYYLAIGIVDIDPWPAASAAYDFNPATGAGRMFAKSGNAGLGTIELHGIDNTGRDVIYLDCTETTGVTVHTNLSVEDDLTVEGLSRAYGFGIPDLTESHVAIGTGGDGNGTPVINFINAGAPADQKQWLIAALTDKIIFTATADNEEDFYWMVALRTGSTVTEVDILAPLVHLEGDLMLDGDIEGDLTINGDLQANTADFTACNVNGSPVLTRAELPPDAIPYPPAGIAVSEEDAWGLSIDPASLATWPGAGIPVSTGNAWDISIAVANVPLLNLANIFTQPQSVGGSSGAGITPYGYGLTITRNVSNSLAETDFISGNGELAGGFNWYIVAPSTVVNDTTSAQMRLDAAGNATFDGGVFSTAVIVTQGASLPFQANTLHVGYSGSTAFIDSTGASPSAQGDIFFRTLSSNASIATAVLHIESTGITVTGAKNFSVPHPHIDGKELVHSCLEGPEIGVFYRGEVTTKEGQAEVVLPDYFESLTFEDDRSVLLAQIVESDGEALALLAATRVIDGRFSIRSSADVRVAWEVKAVRRIGVERLNIVRDKFVPKAQEEKSHEQRKPRRTAN